jgi:hypothetical protein
LPKITFQKIIKSDRKNVFELATSYKNFQIILPQYFPSIRIISVRENVSIVEEHLRICGRELVMMAKHVINDPITHEIFIIGGDAKGTHITSRYEQLSHTTKLTLEIEWKFKGIMKLFDFFNRHKMASEYSKIIDEFIAIAET